LFELPFLVVTLADADQKIDYGLTLLQTQAKAFHMTEFNRTNSLEFEHKRDDDVDEAIAEIEDEHESEIDEMEGEHENKDSEEGSGGHCNKMCDYQHHYLKLSGLNFETQKRLQHYTIKGQQGLGVLDPAKRAVIVLHGVGMNPYRYLCYAYNALKLSGGNLTDWYVTAIGFHDTERALDQSDHRRRRRHQSRSAMHWPHFHHWMYGEDTGAISSFDALDQVVRVLAQNTSYPNLKEIIFLGHGGGAQMLHRYAIGNHVDPLPGIDMRYIVANPSTFMFLDNRRPQIPNGTFFPRQEGCVDTADWTDGKNGWTCHNYETMGYCASGKVTMHSFGMMGQKYSNPEENCCVCGGGRNTYDVEFQDKMPHCLHYNPRDLQKRIFTHAPVDMSHPNAFLLWAADGEQDVAEDEKATCAQLYVYPYGRNGAPKFFQTQEWESFVRRFAHRNVVYMSAYDDSCNNDLQGPDCGYCCVQSSSMRPEGGCELDHHEVKYPLIRTCGAMAQGLTRVERAVAYWSYIKDLYGENSMQSFLHVEGKHSSCAIFQSEYVRNLLFKW